MIGSYLGILTLKQHRRKVLTSPHPDIGTLFTTTYELLML